MKYRESVNAGDCILRIKARGKSVCECREVFVIRELSSSECSNEINFKGRGRMDG